MIENDPGSAGLPAQEGEAGATPPEALRFGPVKTIGYSLLPLVVFLVVCESMARVVERWAPPRAIDIGRGFTRDTPHFVPDPNDPGFMMTNPARDIWPAFKDRFAMPKPAGHFRMFALGGSSMRNLGKFERLKERVEPCMKEGMVFETINTGVDSFGSHRVRLIAEEVMGYDADLVFLYAGHNEFTEEEIEEASDLHLLWCVRLADAFALSRFFRDRLIAHHIAKVKDEYGPKNAVLSEGLRDSWQRQSIPERMNAYRENLRAIITTCRIHHVPIVIGTVSFNVFGPEALSLNMKEAYEEAFADGRYEEGAKLVREMLRTHRHHQASDLENEIIRELARDYEVPLADVETAVRNAEPHGVPGETLFNLHDFCHLSAEGNNILQETCAGPILPILARMSHKNCQPSPSLRAPDRLRRRFTE